MTDRYGRTYTPLYAVSKLVLEKPNTWKTTFHGVDEYDTYELADRMCARRQLKAAPNERYVIVEVRYYHENDE